MARRPETEGDERGPKPLGEAVRRIVSKGARRGARSLAEAEAKWREVVGPEVAAHTRVRAFDRRVLRVGVDSSALLAELAGFYSEGLLESLQSGERPLPVVDLRFELGRDL